MTIRVRLTIAFVAVVLLANLALTLVTIRHVGNVLIGEVQNRVRLDLNAAREVYGNQVQGIARFLRAVCLDDGLALGLQANDRADLGRRLEKVRAENRTDMLWMVDPAGRVICRAGHPAASDTGMVGNEVIEAALQAGAPASGTVIVPGEILREDGIELPSESPGQDGSGASASQPTSSRAVREGGMVVAAAVPVRDESGRLLGVLYGANLLNGQYRIVDAIRDLVFQDQTYNGKTIGAVTIFQGDRRVSTNVFSADGQRAIGTRMSPAVADEVLGRGQVYAQRAFVVNDWYISAYEPITDPRGRVIGALYVGLLEAPFVHTQHVIVGVFVASVTVTALATLVLLYFVTKLILRPIGRVIVMSRKVIGGDLSARVGIRRRGEMGALLTAIDDMAEAVAQREEKLKAVARQQLGQSEKLASIGRLAAGIAHEVNNPLTGVLTFAHLLRDKKNMEVEDRSDLDLIIRETTRVRDIVRGLLDFARESPSRRQPLDINGPVRQMLTLLRSQKEFKQIRIEEDLTANLPEVSGDQNQLQQVLLNLALNACEAMPGGGTLTIRTACREGQVLIEVADSGHGIRREHLDKIFDPFFTTKPAGRGTGLGLSVSYGIVQQHGGTLEVFSDEGKGSTFTVSLPVVQEQTR